MGAVMVRRSRVAVVVWAVILSLVALLLARGYAENENKNLIDLAFGILTYTYGPLLGVLLAAILPGRRWVPGLHAGVALSVLCVALIRPELPQLLGALGWKEAAASLAGWRPNLAFPWFYPLFAGLTLLLGCLPLGRGRGNAIATRSSH